MGPPTRGRKRQPGGGLETGRGQRARQGRPSKRRRKVEDIYEAVDEEIHEEKHARHYDHVENYEYELPSDFEDEEIDEELAFTEEDRLKYGGWFGDTPGSPGARKAARVGEFDDLDSGSDGDDASDGDADEDEDIQWDEGEEEGIDAAGRGSHGGSDDEDKGADDDEDDEEEEEEEEEEDDEDNQQQDDDAHRAMLTAVLGRDASAPRQQHPRRALAAARNKVVAEAYPESDVHATTGGNEQLQLSDLMASLGGSSGAAVLRGARQMLEQLERRSAPVAAPLPRNVAERLERRAGYEDSKQDVTKWQPLVKANREAPTLRFTAARHEVAETVASAAAIAEGFTPNMEDPEGLEAQVAALLGAAGAAGVAAMEEADAALAEREITAEEAAERAARLSKMRNLLFYSEQKAKRLAKIKSKEHHRRANRAARRAAERRAEAGGDEAAEAAAAKEDAEYERAKERLTLKHKNSSRWARRALKRGQPAMDASMRAALAEQLALGAQLRQRVEGGGSPHRGSDASDGAASTSASDSDNDNEAGQEKPGGGSRAGGRSRKEALDILRGLAEPPAGDTGGDGVHSRAGLFGLPFMVRALERQRAAAAQQATELVAQLEAGGDGIGGGNADGGAVDDFVAAAAASAKAATGAAGRMSFGGASAAAAARARARDELGSDASGSDDEEDAEAKAARLTAHLAAGTNDAAGSDAGPAVAAKRQTRAAAAAAAHAAGAGAAGAAASEDGSKKARRPPRGTDVGHVDIELPEQQQQQQQPQLLARDALFVARQQTAAGNTSRAQRQSGAQPSSLQAASADECVAPQFVQADGWQGRREGYAFKQGQLGLGYYKDVQQQQQQSSRKGQAASRHARTAEVLLQQPQAQADDSSSDAVAQAAEPLDHHQQQQQQQQHKRGSSSTNRATKDQQAPMVEQQVNGGGMTLLSGGNAELQRRLMAAAFAGDDVEADFAADKAAEVESQLPPEDVPSALPGWGGWASKAAKDSPWMVAARAKAAAARERAAAARADASLKHVVVSERYDKRSAKYCSAGLPYPFTDRAAYEASLRRPLGRQYNPDAAFRNLTRPPVLKTTGVVIAPARLGAGGGSGGDGAGAGGRVVITVAGGVQLPGQAAGSGAGGIGRGGNGGKKPSPAKASASRGGGDKKAAPGKSGRAQKRAGGVKRH